MIPWHPVVVHFPLALVVTAALALSAARLEPLRRQAPASAESSVTTSPKTLAETLAIVGTWDLCLGALAALAALATGLGAVLHLEVAPPARLALALHVKWAIFSTAGLVLLAAWRGAGNAADSRPSAVFLMLLWAVTSALVVTGYRGGQNVYLYGTGVAPGSRIIDGCREEQPNEPCHRYR